MKYQVVSLLAFVVGSVSAQGVTDKIAPEFPAPPECTPSLDGNFQIIISDPEVKAKRATRIEKRGLCHSTGEFLGQLKDGVLTDDKSRTGYIASNFQLQFDDPPQAGALLTTGFAHCPNDTLALGDNVYFYKCKSGTFYNIYDRYWAPQCEPIQILMRQCNNDGQLGVDDHVVGKEVVATTIVVPLGDGQPQVVATTVAIPLCQIDDGQLQGHTTPCAAIAAVPAADATLAPASQLPDGQIQVTPIGSGPPLATEPGPVIASVPAPSTSGVPNAPIPHSAASPSHTDAKQTPGAPATGDAKRNVQTSSLVAFVMVFVGLISAL